MTTKVPFLDLAKRSPMLFASLAFALGLGLGFLLGLVLISYLVAAFVALILVVEIGIYLRIGAMEKRLPKPEKAAEKKDTHKKEDEEL